MKSSNFLILFLAIIVAEVSCAIDDYIEATLRGNEYVDKVLHDTLLEHGSEYDPYILEDKVIGFWKKVLFVNVTGEASLHSGFIRGFSTLYRSDACHLYEEDQKLKILADLGAGILDMRYSGTAKFMNVGPTITVHGEVDYVEVTLKMSVNITDGRDGNLDEFHIDEIKGMKVWITGLGPLNWAVNTMIKTVTSVFRGYIHRGIESLIQSYISKSIQDYQFPVEGMGTLNENATEPMKEKPPEEQTTKHDDLANGTDNLLQQKHSVKEE